MKQLILSAIATIAIVVNLQAQVAIHVKNKNKEVYRYATATSGGYDANILQQVISNDCADGDTIYLPGDILLLQGTGDITISKRLHFVGAGIHPDSTNNLNVGGMNATTLQADYVYLISTGASANTGASGSTFHGIKFIAKVKIGTTMNNQNVNGAFFNRCEFDRNVALGYNTSGSLLASDIEFRNCLFRDLSNARLECFEAANVRIISSVVEHGYISGTLPNTEVENNIIYNFYQTGNSTQGTTFNNNIFIKNASSGTYLVNYPQCYFYNNLWLSGASPIFTAANANASSVNPARPIAGVFITASPSYTLFDYQTNFHLNTTHANYADHSNLNGSGAVGLYGLNTNTWKDGLVPFHAHWVYFPNNNIGTTDNGLLAIRVKASAQLENGTANKIDSIRYWSDVTNAFPTDLKAIAITPAAQIAHDTLLFDFCEYTAGTRRVYFQLRDTRGQWSAVLYRDVVVVTPPSSFQVQVNANNMTSPFALGLQWYEDSGNAINGALLQSVTPNHSGRYFAVLSNHCDTLHSDTVLFCVVMPIPTITTHGDTLTSSTGYGYQWYDNNGAISGANTQSFAPTANGSYYVVVSDVLGCTSPQSANVNFVINSIEDMQEARFVLYPNPTSGQFAIETKNGESFHVIIADILGNKLLEQNYMDTKAFIELQQPSGIYFARVSTSKEQTLIKLILQ